MTHAQRKLKPGWIEKERIRGRLKMLIYRKKYPERRKASYAKQRAKPDYKEKSARSRRAWYDNRLAESGKQRWSVDDRSKHLKEQRMRYQENETVEQRARRMAVLRTPEVNRKRSETGRSLGPNHSHALCWSLCSPDGKIFQFKNLAAFIRENRGLFTEEQLVSVNKFGRTRIEAAIAMLSPRRKKCVEHCCGWTWHVNSEKESLLI
jgi:hypothetical protein